MSFIGAFRNGLWPGGKLKPPSVPRTSDEKLQTRDDANRKLSALIPGIEPCTYPLVASDADVYLQISLPT
jgi:hypothetical protein